MANRIELTQEELTALENLLEQELRNCLVELRHTDNIEYKELVRTNIAMLHRLTKALRTASPA